MVQVNLKEEEVLMLENILMSYLSDLRMEIADTDQKDFREDLKRKEEFLKRFLNRLAEKRG